MHVFAFGIISSIGVCVALEFFFPSGYDHRQTYLWKLMMSTRHEESTIVSVAAVQVLRSLDVMFFKQSIFCCKVLGSIPCRGNWSLFAF